MKRDTIMSKSLKSSFYSCEKDAETIINKLFVSSNPYSEELKRLLIINTKDCLDKSNTKYQEIVKNTSVKELFEEKYISLVPKIKMKEHQKEQSYIIISFDSFTPTSNTEFRDCVVSFDIYCPMNNLELENYSLRVFKIAGIIDGILSGSKLSGIGRLNFLGFSEIISTEEICGYSLMFEAVHGGDDQVPPEV